MAGLGRYTVLNSNDLSNAMAYYKGGETITVTVQRMIDGQYQEVKLDVTLAFKKDQKN